MPQKGDQSKAAANFSALHSRKTAPPNQTELQTVDSAGCKDRHLPKKTIEFIGEKRESPSISVMS